MRALSFFLFFFLFFCHLTGTGEETRRDERGTGKDVMPMTMAQLLLFVVALLLLSKPDQTRPDQLVRYLRDHPPMQPTGWDGLGWDGKEGAFDGIEERLCSSAA